MSTPIATEDEVLSGEAVTIDVQPIGLLVRVLGAVIDVLLSIGLYVLFLFLRIWALDAGLIDESVDRVLNVTSLVVCAVVAPVAMEVSLRGRSLGKLAVGGRIVRLDGGATGFRHAFIRALLGVLEIYMTLGAVAILTGAFTARSQRLGDLVAGTYSQRVRTPDLVAHEPVMPPALLPWASVADVARLPDRLARRISQFLRTAGQMSPASRARIAAELCAEASVHVSPQPNAPAEQVLAAITVIRRERERRALVLADQRAERLTGRSIGL